MINVNETIRYLFYGVVVTGINFLFYNILLYIGLDYRVANISSMLVAKAAAFFCNKYLVFRKNNSLERNEIFRFIFARVLSGFVDFFGLIIIVSGLHFDEVYGKVFMLIVVTIMNYVLGKYFVFRK